MRHSHREHIHRDHTLRDDTHTERTHTHTQMTTHEDDRYKHHRRSQEFVLGALLRPKGPL